MTNYCPDSCGLCEPDIPTTTPSGDGCEDSEPRCEIWKRFGLCRLATYNGWMANKCAKSCDLCEQTTNRPNKQNESNANRVVQKKQIATGHQHFNMIDDLTLKQQQRELLLRGNGRGEKQTTAKVETTTEKSRLVVRRVGHAPFILQRPCKFNFCLRISLE